MGRELVGRRAALAALTVAAALVTSGSLRSADEHPEQLAALESPQTVGSVATGKEPSPTPASVASVPFRSSGPIAGAVSRGGPVGPELPGSPDPPPLVAVPSGTPLTSTSRTPTGEGTFPAHEPDFTLDVTTQADPAPLPRPAPIHEPRPAAGGQTEPATSSEVEERRSAPARERARWQQRVTAEDHAARQAEARRQAALALREKWFQARSAAADVAAQAAQTQCRPSAKQLKKADKADKVKKAKKAKKADAAKKAKKVKPGRAC